MCTSQNQRIYDPDLSALLLMAFAAVSSVSGIYGSLTNETLRREKKRDAKVEFEMRRVFQHNIDPVVFDIKRGAGRIGEYIGLLNDLYAANTPPESKLALGTSLLLGKADFQRYENFQTKLLEEIYPFVRKVTSLERMLAEMPASVNIYPGAPALQTLHNIIELVRLLQSKTANISFAEFYTGVRDICSKIQFLHIDITSGAESPTNL